MGQIRIRSDGLLRVALVGLVACNAIAGIGVPVLEADDGGGAMSADAGKPALDANVGTPALDAGAPADEAAAEDGATGMDANVADTDVPDTNGPDTLTPPPPAAKPGYDLSAAGTFGRSATFSLIAVVGESPGGNNVGKSQSFQLKAGVIAVTQPN